MKGAVLFTSPGKLEIEELALDSVRESEVLIRVAATGLCHSDLHHMDRATPDWTPAVLGHEGAGVVEAVGSAVDYVKPGDHVITFPSGFCGSCDYCLSGRPTLCPRRGMVRADGTPRIRRTSGEPVRQFASLGTFAEQMLVHEHHVVKVRDDIPFDRAALVGCAVPTGLGAVLRTAKVPAGADVAIVGCGGIGLNVVQGAVLAGANHIIAIDINDGKLALAKSFGATHLINSASGDVHEQLDAVLPGRGGVDYAFEAAGTTETFQLCFSLLREGGTATMIGVPSGDMTIPAAPIVRERKIQGSAMGSVQFRKDLPYFLDLYLDGRLKLDELVSNRIRLDEINEGFAAITDGSIARSVVVFD